MEQYDAIIVGAGHNGLVSSWYLARAGLRVLVLERRELVGGACVTEELWPAVRIPTCSYVCHLLQAKVIEDMALRRFGFAVYPLDPYVFIPFPDGRYGFSWLDDDRMRQEVARFSRHDAATFPRFQEVRRRLAGLLHRDFLAPPPTWATLRERLQDTDDASLLERLLSGSVTDLLDEYFESAYVKALFVWAWDAGDPAAPGSLLSAAYAWLNILTPHEDVGIVHGGMGGITQAMARSAEDIGVTIRTNAEVARVVVDNGAVTGVTLANGEEVRSRLVLSNADPKHTFLRLVPDGDLDPLFVARVRAITTQVAYLKFHARLRALPDFSRHLGADYDPRLLAQIRIAPSVEYYRQSWRDAQDGLPSRSPVMVVQIPSVHDPTLAPGGEHVLSIWVQYAPVRPRAGTWDELRQRAGEDLIDALAAYAPNIREAIRDWTLFTPLDIERRVGMTDGNIRHIDMVRGQMGAERPLAGWSDYRTPLHGLYLCGAGTHPGGEVTGAPGHNAAHQVLADFARAADK